MQKSLFEQKKSRVGGVTVNSPVFLGGGVVKSPLAPELVSYLEEVEVVGAVTIGSITPDERNGNTGVLNWPNVTGAYDTFKAEGGLHANGMRNLGIVETMNNLPTNSLKPVIISVAGYSTEDYTYALNTIVGHKNASAVKAIEVNCSCPTMGCAPFAYSLDALEGMFVEIKKLQLTKPLWFKLSPYFTTERIAIISAQYPAYDFSACPTVTEEFMTDLQKLLREYVGIMSAVIVSNGLPQVGRGSEIQIEKADGKVITVAGLSGTALKAGNIETIKFMKTNGLALDIIGCGGVLSKQDVIDYLDAGAAAVQCSGGPIWGGGVGIL
jgi:dihydroorotate dehydrogenase (NAD+) catalytic subunit